MISSKSSTSLFQKIALFLFGILVLFASLEIGLRLAGAMVYTIQSFSNRVSYDPREIRVLCVGDSMTALGGMNAYPRQLQGILNEQDHQHRPFQVINEGMVSASSSIIFLNFEKNLIRYKPHVVVVMMGINDRAFFDQLQMPKFFSHLRCYKLFRMIVAHINQKYLEHRKRLVELQNPMPLDADKLNSETHFFQETTELLEAFNKQYEVYLKRLEQETLQENRESLEIKMASLREAMVIRLMGTGHEYRMRGDYGRAMKYLQAAITVAPNNFLSYVELGRCLKDQKHYKEAAGLFAKAIELHPGTIIAEMELASCYEQTGQHSKATKLFEEISIMQSKHSDVKGDIGEMLLKNKDYATAERVILRAIKENPSDHQLYENLALLYQNQGLVKQAKDYFQKALSIKNQANELKPITIENFREMATIAKRHQVKFVVMQYPLRDVEYLKNIFLAKQVDAFIENKVEFREALKSAYWSEYFTDSFGGDFGHCTRKGNRLIAENVSKEIFSVLNN